MEQFAHSFAGLLLRRGSRVGKSSNAIVFIRCSEGEVQLLGALL